MLRGGRGRATYPLWMQAQNLLVHTRVTLEGCRPGGYGGGSGGEREHVPTSYRRLKDDSYLC